MSDRFIKRSQLASVLKHERGIDISDSCVERWLRKGVRGKVLPCQFIGGCRYVTEADLTEFLEHKNRPAYQTNPMGEIVRAVRTKEKENKLTQIQRQEGVEQAAANLKQRGIDID